ncbi:hypothetical protein [Microtetraspora malaysiensis]|uniref:hypothetical protein n=1 Tax=Microtetraspora malaysiensis TaxID=161358 RepID=UPI000AD8BE50|nr:hypothetical protein [Microtetraspora malaysiensis]
MIAAVGQFQRDPQNELTAEGITAAEAEGRYRGRRRLGSHGGPTPRFSPSK